MISCLVWWPGKSLENHTSRVQTFLIIFSLENNFVSFGRKWTLDFLRFIQGCYCRIPWIGLLTYSRDLFLSTLKVQTYDQSDNIWCLVIACLMVSRRQCLHMTERTREIISILFIRVLITYSKPGPFSKAPPCFSHLQLQHDFWWKVRIQSITYWVFMYG